MNFSERDQDILLYEHGALRGWRRVWVGYLLKHNPHYQERRAAMVGLSLLMADAIRTDALPPRAFTLTEALRESALEAGRGASPRSPQTQGQGSGSLRPLPAARPGFVLAATSVGLIIAASAFAYKALAITPYFEEQQQADMFEPAPGFYRMQQNREKRGSMPDRRPTHRTNDDVKAAKPVPDPTDCPTRSVPPAPR